MDGNYFLISKRTAKVRALSQKVVLISLSANTLKIALEASPESIQAITISCEERIKKAKLRNESQIFTNNSVATALIDSITPKEAPAVGLVYMNNEMKHRKTKEKNDNEPLAVAHCKMELSKSMQILHSTIIREKRIKNILNCTIDELNIIFRKVSISDKMKLRRICTAFYEIMLSTASWKEMRFNEINRKLQIPVFNELISIANITLELLDLSNCDMLTDINVEQVVEHCANLTTLNISNCWKLTDKSLAAISQKLFQLKILKISHCPKIRGVGFENHNLKSLTLLDASFCKQLGDKHLEKLLTTTPKMVSIYLNRCQRITEFGIFLIARFCRHIQHLHFEDCIQFTDRCMKWLTSSCLELKTLNLKFCRGFTYLGFQELSISNLNLTSLNFSNCPIISDSIIKEFGLRFRNIRSLYLRQCNKITDFIAFHLARTAPKLEVLDIRGCPFTTLDGFRLVFKAVGLNAKVLIDIDPKLRGINQPGHPNKPRLQEFLVREVFTSYPRELKLGLGLLENNNVVTQESLNVKGMIKAKVKKTLQKSKKKAKK
jgi:hypothetical protein